MGAPTITNIGMRLMCLDAFLLHFFTVLLTFIPPKKHSLTIQIVSLVHESVNTKMTRFRNTSVTKSLFSEKMRFTP